MQYLKFISLFSLLFLLSACGNDEPGDSVWAIPVEEVEDGGPGKDGIPSVDDPKFDEVNNINYMNDDDLIIGIKVGSEVRGYTHPVLDWHEIINDKIGNTAFALTYCPLTGTGIGWDRLIDGNETTFGVSGLLYNANLIPYDRATDSNYSQFRLDCVNGDRIGEKVGLYQVFETDWKTWKAFFPDSRVVTTETGANRNYGNYPYGSYRTSESLIFSVDVLDNRLPLKERVLGVIVGTNTTAYRFNTFGEIGIKTVEDQVGGTEVVVAGSQEHNFIVAFQRTTADGTLLDFTALQDQGEVVMEDNEGNQWNIFGEAVSGPRAGERLESVNSFIGYWFGWGAFYPGIEIFTE